MNSVKVCLLVATCGAFGVSGNVLGEVQLPEASFLNWAGFIDEVTLADGSVLSEYSAKTVSFEVDGAALEITFAPRFECAPMLSVRMPGSFDGIAEDQILKITTDDFSQNFKGFMENDGDASVYSLAVPVQEVEKLRRIIDVTSRFNIKVMSRADQNDGANAELSASPAEALPGVSFSLLGSQKTTAFVESLCWSHLPRPYSPYKFELGSQ